MTFLERLQSYGVNTKLGGLIRGSDTNAEDSVGQLLVDVYQTEQMIVIYGQCAGADIRTIQVSIEGNSDIILIEGESVSPEHVTASSLPTNKPGTYVAQECLWGNFYRRIILPVAVDTQASKAKVRNGVLILELPLIEQPVLKRTIH